MYSNDLADLMLWYLIESNETESVIMSSNHQDDISVGDAARIIADAHGTHFKARINDSK